MHAHKQDDRNKAASGKPRLDIPLLLQPPARRNSFKDSPFGNLVRITGNALLD